MSDMKPCPFCGDARWHLWGTGHEWAIACSKCEAASPRENDLELAIRAWNTRALPAVQRKVKPLVWDKPLGGFHIAKLPFGGEIRIMWDLHPADGERYILHPFSLGRRVFRTLDTAKAAAQADYDLSALEPAVQPDKINWRDDPDAIVEDDEPQIGRDYE